MSDIKDFLRDVGYFGVGAAAVILEAGGKAVKSLVKKGAQTLHDNQETVDELKRKAQELGDKVKDSVEKAVKPDPVDAAKMTPEERADLRRQLDEADEAACPVCDEEDCDCGCADEDDEPVAPDAVYRTEALPEEEPKPEDTPNG